MATLNSDFITHIDNMNTIVTNGPKRRLHALNQIMHNWQMNKRQSKAEIRRELEQQVRDYVREGGEIKRVRPGVSGLEEGAVLRPSFSDGRPVQPRTPAMDVLAAIDARRKQGKPGRKDKRKLEPTKKIIYDDFGEPLREVWEDS